MDSIWNRIRHLSEEGIRVENLAYLINEDSLKTAHKKMDGSSLKVSGERMSISYSR